LPAEHSPEGDLDELHDRLANGLESCRSVIANYKSLLTSDQLEAAAETDLRSNEASDPFEQETTGSVPHRPR
jgi:hypothetical protein